jgi:hypothetical protein
MLLLMHSSALLQLPARQRATAAISSHQVLPPLLLLIATSDSVV